MSDDTLNVDSDEELSTGAEVGADESASEETTDESGAVEAPKGKEKALRDTEAAIKERQAEFTRLSQQIAELKGSMNTLTQLQQKPKEEAKDWMESLEADKVIEDPLAAMKAVVTNLRKEIAAVLTDRDAYLLSRVSAPAIDPELKSIVDGLKADPDLADLPDNKLVAMAKKMQAPKKAVMTPRGNISSTGRTASATPRKPGQYTPEQIAWLKASGAMKTNDRDDTLE